MKFSIIIPVYNVEKYLSKCLDSVINQSYKNYECILVCDKSIDSSNKIAAEYAQKYNFKKLYYENTGLSEARNIGIDNSSGDYILFLDSDDYIEYDLLETLAKEINDEDLVRFQVREVFNDKMVDWNQVACSGTGIECFSEITNFYYVENAWAYCYKSSFYKNNNFRFMKDCIAEDYGLIPLIIAKAKKMKVIKYIGYNYLQRSNSLMNNNSYQRKLIKMEDMLKQSKFLVSEFKKIKNSDIFIRFIDDSLIYYSTTLKYKDFRKYNKKFKKINVFDYIIDHSLKHKIKKILIKTSPYFFYRYIMRLR